MYIYICSQITAASDWPRLFLHPRCFCLVKLTGRAADRILQYSPVNQNHKVPINNIATAFNCIQYTYHVAIS